MLTSHFLPLTRSDVEAIAQGHGAASVGEGCPAAPPSRPSGPRSTSHAFLTRGKTILSFLQIMASLGAVFQVPWPPATAPVLGWTNFANIRVAQSLSLSCTLPVTFHTELLYTTLSVPVCVALILASLLLLKALRRFSALGQPAAVGGLDANAIQTQQLLRRLRSCWPLTMELTLHCLAIVYVLVTRVIFDDFVCERFDNGDEYLVADSRIDCSDPDHQTMVAYASICCVLFVVGFPIAASLCLCVRGRLGRVPARRGWGRSSVRRAVNSATAPLVAAYRPGAPYAAVAELVRQSVHSGWLALLYQPEAPSTGALTGARDVSTASGAELVQALGLCYAFASAYAYFLPMADPVSNSVHKSSSFSTSSWIPRKGTGCRRSVEHLRTRLALHAGHHHGLFPRVSDSQPGRVVAFGRRPPLGRGDAVGPRAFSASGLRGGKHARTPRPPCSGGPLKWGGPHAFDQLRAWSPPSRWGR